MIISDSPDALALLQTILERPEDDAARLIYADWLEDHGETAHSEFIRVQIELAQRCGMPKGGEPVVTDDKEADAEEVTLRRRERELLAEGPEGGRSDAWDWMGQHVEAMVPHGAAWEKHVTFRRGFVAGIRCTLAQWFSVPIPCRRCVGHGTIAGQACDLCKGGLVTWGHGPAVCGDQPVEWVEAVGAEPYVTHASVFWFSYEMPPTNTMGDLPTEVFDILARRPESAGSAAAPYEGEEEAKAALSVAMLLWARCKAGLPDRTATAH